MDTRTFLALVVPWDTGDYITVHWQRPDKKWPGRSCRSIDDVLKVVGDALATKQNNIFFCLAAQKVNSGKRSRENSTAVRSLWVDMDIDPDNPKKYASVEEAIAALFDFCALAKIPKPSIIVKSGGGIHAYWLSNKTILAGDWQPYADALKASCLGLGLKIDAACTADISRVLRVPDTINYKYDPPRPVELMQEHCNGIQHDFSVAFSEIVIEEKEEKIEIAEAFKNLIPDHDMGGGIEIREVPPLPFEPIKEECGWLREAYVTGGKEFTNAQWNLTTLCATWLEDGHDLAHRFANQYPTYRYQQTEELWERKNRERRASNIGWPYCRTIAGEGSAHCRTCPHLAKNKSPLNLGYAVVADAVNDEAENKEIALLDGTRPPQLRLPKGFCVNGQGKICAVIRTQMKGKTLIPGKLMVLLLSHISDPSFRFQDGFYGVGFTVATEKGKSWDVFLPSSYCTSDKLNKFLLSKFALPNSDKEAQAMTVKFAISWLEKLKEDPAVHDSGYMGWRHEGGAITGFIYGNTLYRDNGEIVPLVKSSDDEAFFSWYQPQGKREAWFEAANLLTSRKRPELDILISIAFAAPLTAFAGTLYGAILSIWGRPGSSKSTAQQVAAAVWGHPKQTRESLTSTPKSIQGRLGRTRNLPAYWDDVQDEKHQDALFATMFVASEGAEGGRLNPDASYKQRLEWQTLLVACSNASFVEYLTKKQKSTTAGMRRVFEIEFNPRDNEPGIINHVDASQTFQALEHNFGIVGAEYAKILAQNHKDIHVLVSKTIKNFTMRVQGTPDEYYWSGLCGVLIAGATIASWMGVQIDVPAMEEFLVTSFLDNRLVRSQEGTEGGSYANTEQALTGFLNFYTGNGNILFVDKMFVNRHTVVEPLGKGPLAGRPIYIQVARDERKITISKRALREWLHQNDIHPRQVLNGLVRFFKSTEGKKTLGAGTVWSQTQEQCIEILLSEDRNNILEHIMAAWGEPTS